MTSFRIKTFQRKVEEAFSISKQHQYDVLLCLNNSAKDNSSLALHILPQTSMCQLFTKIILPWQEVNVPLGLFSKKYSVGVFPLCGGTYLKEPTLILHVYITETKLNLVRKGI